MRAIAILHPLAIIVVILCASLGSAGEKGDDVNCPAGDGACRLPACPTMEAGVATVSAGWGQALTEWDAEAQAAYLEWDVRGAGEAFECMCEKEGSRIAKNWMSEVILDGIVVAEQADEEGGAVIGGLSLGRHIGVLNLLDVCASTVVRDDSMFHHPSHCLADSERRSCSPCSSRMVLDGAPFAGC